MLSKVYIFRVVYEGFEKLIWRKIAVPCTYRLDQLGYLIMVIFDTLSYHLFEIFYKDKSFGIPDENGDMYFDRLNLRDFKLEQLDLKPGSRISMDYNISILQTFSLRLVKIEDVQDQKQNKNIKYPYVIKSAGSGIIENVSGYYFEKFIEQINLNGKTDTPIYYPYENTLWDYRNFNCENLNFKLHEKIKQVEKSYAKLFKT